MKTACTTGEEIRKAVATLMIEHTAFSDILKTLKRRVADTFKGFPPCFEFVFAPSRCGKSELLKVIASDYPEIFEHGRRQIPLLIVHIQAGVAAKDLPIEVIKALGVPEPKGSVRKGTLNSLMFKQLKLANVRVILFDEASHLVEIGTHIPPRAASDWFKDLQVSADPLRMHDIGIVLTGVPRLQRLLDSNEQVRNRAHRPLMLMPYRFDIAVQRQAFAGCVIAFLEEFMKRGCLLEQPLNSFVRHCYVASAGHVGLLAKFFDDLAALIDDPCTLSRSLCSEACSNLILPGDGMISPFGTADPSDVDLMHILVAELDRYRIVLRPDSVDMELAQAKANATRRGNV